jgi:hypothetical protein
MNTETIWILNISLSCVGMAMLLATRYFRWGYDSGKSIPLISDEDSELLEKAHKIIREATHEYYFRGYYRHWEEVKFDAQNTLSDILGYAQKTETYKKHNELHDLVIEIFKRAGNNAPDKRFNGLLKEHIIENYRKLLRVPKKQSTLTPGPESGSASSTGTPGGGSGASGGVPVITAASAAEAAAAAANVANTVVHPSGVHTAGDLTRASKMDEPDFS